MSQTNKDVEPNFEDALKELEEIVTKMEAPQTTLNSSLTQFERGIALVRQCEDALTKAKQRVEVLTAHNA